MFDEVWRSQGEDVAPGVVAALLHLAAAGDRPVLVVSRPRPPEAPERPRVRWSNAPLADVLGVAPADLQDLPVERVLRGAGAPGALVRERCTRFAVEAVTASGAVRAVEVAAWPVPERVSGFGAVSERLHVDLALAAEDHWVLQLVAPDDERSRAALRAAEERFTTLAQDSPVPTVVSDVGARLSRVNDAFAVLLGVPADQLHGTGWLAHVPDEERDRVAQAVADVLAGERVAFETRLRTADGLVRWVAVRLAPSRTPGHGAGFVGTVEDVTDRRARERRLAYQAQHDLLTGLANRLALLDHLGELLAGGARTPAGVLMVDLDDFKTVNDGLGPEAGDAVLVEVGRRLARAVRTGDLVARPGGDEFVLVCHDLPDEAAVQATARRVLECLVAPVEVNGLSLRVAASVGVVLLDGAPGGAEEVVRDVGIATHEAKAAGGGRWAVLDEDVRQRARRSLRLVADLREALARGALDVHYQPVVRPGTPTRPGGLLLSVEALARWRHPELGPIDPQTFIEVAERANLVPVLDAHVLAVACRDLAAWRAAATAEGLAHVPRRVAVNVSAVSLSAEGFAEGVRRTVAGAGLQLEDVCLEVTETALASDLRACRAVLEELRREGARVAIDDFGTGYSSLSYLVGLPVDHLKVDRSFVRDLRGGRAGGARGGPARAVAAAVVTLARTLGLDVVAEGVETPEQNAVLVELGCEAVQGYLYARPMPREELWAVLRGGGVLDPDPAAPGLPAPRQVSA
ncbi:putative bifunctional diguanylate cyclase/phosphodiesterase [Kineococcus gypseus]|uniref:putative bifunctional diguanylate cyclase/phosphodiesterase n=1 Tax=Kineococcus gypseus TaxID=1637102 RepID=UPI003D7E971A